MWFFKVPEFYFGSDALRQLRDLKGERALIVTDRNLVELGLVEKVTTHLTSAEIATALFDEVEPDPAIDTVRRGAQAALDFAPDWVIGVGGGSCLDAAKAIWILYEQPELTPEEINPWMELTLRQKARLLLIPTTAGTGSESNYASILTDPDAQRKLTVGARDATPDLAIVDPTLSAEMPTALTAETGIDVLTHAIEAISCTWANDFTDGLALQAARMVFDYLPRAVANGSADPEAREKMANAAAIAGMTLGNSSVALAHALGHCVGAVFKTIPHGRVTAIFLPATIRFMANGGVGRYLAMARMLGLTAEDETTAAEALASAVEDLMQRVDVALTLADAGVDSAEFEAALPAIVANVDMDANTLQSRRLPETEEIERLLRYAYEGKRVDF